MPLHLIKLCVGADSVDDHRAWIAATLARKRDLGLPVEQVHTTRMAPKQRDAVLDGGSLYWVTKGFVLSRQRIVDLRPFDDADGIARCHIVLDPELVLTAPQPRRPFQGWRYLKAADAPQDLGPAETRHGGAENSTMLKELADLGLL